MSRKKEITAEFMAALTEAQDALKNHISARIFNSADAKDVLQKTNLYIWERAETYNPTRPFMPWAYEMANHQIRKFRLYAGRERLVFDEDVFAMISDEYDERPYNDLRTEALEFCLARLSEADRKRVAMRYERRSNMTEIAKQFTSTPNAESVRIFRIREILRKCIVDRICWLENNGN